MSLQDRQRKHTVLHAVHSITALHEQLCACLPNTARSAAPHLTGMLCCAVLCCAVLSLYVLRQVLVSIQSLILVPQPYFNEPGYEARGNMAESKRYNEVRRFATGGRGGTIDVGCVGAPG
jgi:hypothetical protein